MMEKGPLARTPERYYAGHLSSLAWIWMWPAERANQPRRLNCLAPLGRFTWVILTQVNTYQKNASLPEDLALVQIWKDWEGREEPKKHQFSWAFWFVLGCFRYDFCDFFWGGGGCGALALLLLRMASVCALWNQWHRRVMVTVLLCFRPVSVLRGG